MSFKAIARFDNYVYANIVKGRLESEGIPVFLKDENLVTITHIYSNAVGGIKLMVDDVHYPLAVSALQEGDFSDAEMEFLIDENDVLTLKKSSQSSKLIFHCPECGSSKQSTNILYEIIALLCAVLVLSPPSFINKFKCKNCGNRWSPH